MQNEMLLIKGVAHLIRRNIRLLTQNINTRTSVWQKRRSFCSITEVFFCKHSVAIKAQKFELPIGTADMHIRSVLTGTSSQVRVRHLKTATYKALVCLINIFSYSNLGATVDVGRVKFSCVTPNSTIKPPLHSHYPLLLHLFLLFLQEILPLTPPPLTFFDSWFGEFDKLPRRSGKCVKPAVSQPFQLRVA